MISDAVWAQPLGLTEIQLNEWKAAADGHLSLLIWCLENQKIDEDNYLAWAQKHYQVSHLKNEFFKAQPVPFDLFDQYFEKIPKNAIPVTIWDGTLFIASPEPLSDVPLDVPTQWVLASWIQIVNWRNQYEKEMNAKANGAAALSSLDFGALGGEPVTRTHVPSPTMAAPPVPAAPSAVSPAEPAPPAPVVEERQAETPDTDLAATPKPQPAPVPIKPIAPKPPMPVAPKVTPPPKPMAAPPPPPKAATVATPEPEKTVIQPTTPKPATPAPATAPKPAVAQPRPTGNTNTGIRLGALNTTAAPTSSGTQTRSSIPLKVGGAGAPPPLARAGATPPKPAATNRPMPQVSTKSPMPGEQTNTKIPRPKTPLGSEADEFTKTGFSKTAVGQTKVTRVKLGTDAEQGTATAIRVQRPATNGVVVMDPRFRIDHPKYLKSLDDLPFYLLHRLRDFYDKTMILTYVGGILKPWRWDDSWGHPSDQTQVIAVKDPSMFRIPIQTRTPYHGYVVKSPVHDIFFSEWSPKALPEHVTILPMIVDGNVTGLVLGVVKQNKVSRIRLEDVESIANEAGQLLMTLPNKTSTAA